MPSQLALRGMGTITSQRLGMRLKIRKTWIIMKNNFSRQIIIMIKLSLEIRSMLEPMLDIWISPRRRQSSRKRRHMEAIGRKNKAFSQDYNLEDSPVLMWNASKPSKKMPSYKPLPKLAAHIPGTKMAPTHSRPYSTQDASPPLSCGSRAYDQKRIDSHSRNIEPFETKQELEQKVMNTYQPLYNPPVSFPNILNLVLIFTSR